MLFEDIYGITDGLFGWHFKEMLDKHTHRDTHIYINVCIHMYTDTFIYVYTYKWLCIFINI